VLPVARGAHSDARMGKDSMARCPNCARKVRFWHNHSGYCSKTCRTDSITSCPNCGKVGLYKHARLGCCSEECRYWYVAGLLGYDKDALLTPAWDKIVYHESLPSTSAEISSLQLDELEYDRAVDTVLVVAAPPWMLRSKVLAELPYDRFDNMAWQHLWADGTLTEEELFTFHRTCYEEDLLCQKVGEHVYAKLRQPAPLNSSSIAGPSYAEVATMTMPMLASGTMGATGQTRAVGLPQARISAPSLPPAEFVGTVRALFEERGYRAAPGVAENTLILQRQGRTALAAYQYHAGMIDVDPVQRAHSAAAAAGATQSFVVTNGHFTLQAEDFAAAHPMQLIDGDELAELMERRRALAAVSEGAEDDAVTSEARTEQLHLNGLNGHGADQGTNRRNGANGAGSNGATEQTQVFPATSVSEMKPREARAAATEVRLPESRPSGISFPGRMAPVDAEIVGGEGTA